MIKTVFNQSIHNASGHYGTYLKVVFLPYALRAGDEVLIDDFEDFVEGVWFDVNNAAIEAKLSEMYLDVADISAGRDDAYWHAELLRQGWELEDKTSEWMPGATTNSQIRRAIRKDITTTS